MEFSDNSTVTLKEIYLKEHELQDHYFQGSYEDEYVLGFTTEFKDKYLPKNSTDDFILTLLDSFDNNKEYTLNYYVAYEKSEDTYGLDENYNDVQLISLSRYVYEDHYCSCHRKGDAKKLGAIVENEECEGNRFKIKSIIYNDLTLYSEIYTLEELEEMLRK